MSYALAILWHERLRFLPALVAVAFSALLSAVQCGLLLGLVAFASLPVDRAHADIWVAGPNVVSFDLGRRISTSNVAHLAAQPEVEQCECYLQSFADWRRKDGSLELCMVLGVRLEDSLGAVRELTPELRARLTEPGTVVIDESDLGRLSSYGVGDVTEINGRRVRVVGVVRGLRSFIGSYVFCSLQTARSLLWMAPDQTVYVLARCREPADVPVVAARLRAARPDLSVFTRAELSRRSRIHWLVKTKGGIALGYAAALGLLVGTIVTSQTLYAATAASLREYAVLLALGIPRRRMASLLLTQSFLIGVAGTLLALPATFALARVADNLGLWVQLPPWLLASSAAITVTTAMVSSLTALRLVFRIEPAILLR
jgi:putative ABC transport system permease protein